MVFETKQLLKKFCIVEAGWLLIIFLTHSHERPRLVGTDASWTGGPGFRLKMKSNCQRKQQKRNLSYTNKRGSVILDLSSGKYLRKQNWATVGLNKMLRFPVCITAICALFLTKLQQRNCRCNCDVTGEESFTAKEMSSYKEICWKILVDRTEHAPICWRTLGSIILAICWLSLAICDGFTFLLMSPPEMYIKKKKIEWARGWEDIRFCYKKVIFVCPLAYLRYVPLSVHEKICTMVFDHGTNQNRDITRSQTELKGTEVDSFKGGKTRKSQNW